MFQWRKPSDILPFFLSKGDGRRNERRRESLGIDPGKTPLALVCLRKAGSPPTPTLRKDMKEKTTYIR